MDTFADHISRPWHALVSPASDLHWLFLLSAASIALIIYVTRKLGPLSLPAFFRWAFPRAVYTNPSVRIDLVVFAFNAILLTIPSAALAAAVGSGTHDILSALLGSPPAGPGQGAWSGAWSNVIFTLVLVVCGDAALYGSHRAMHANAVLWEFHKVHHSATVLMPLTAYRQHPVEELITGLVNGLAIGIPGGAFLYLTGGASIIEVGGHNAVEFAALVAARHLRHSHIAVGFGPWLEKVLVSPAMHQLHHSVAPEHLDKNFGQIFSVWDRLWGTFHVSQAAGANLRFGISGMPPGQFATLFGVYVSPLAAALKIVSQEFRRRSG